MLTTDLSLRFDPAYEKISRRFLENPDQFADAFARAWFKLTHRDMGPRARYLGPEVPAEELIWQDPIPAVDHALDRRAGHRALKAEGPRLGPHGRRAGLDRLGLGLDLPRLRQARRRQRRAHPPRAAEGLGGQPARAAREGAEDARRHPAPNSTAAQSGGKKVSLADLIVLAGCAARRAGREERRARRSRCPSRRAARTPRRSRPTSSRSRCSSRVADGFRNYLKGRYSVPAEALLIDRAQLLTLTAPEMTVLIGGLRVLGANVGSRKHGVFTKRPGALTNDFFVNLLDMGTEWKPTSDDADAVRRPRPQDRRS